MQHVSLSSLARFSATAITLFAAAVNVAIQSGPVVLCVESDGHTTIERVCGGPQDYGRDKQIPLPPASYGRNDYPGHAPCTDIALGARTLNKPQQTLDNGRPQIKSPAPALAEYSDIRNTAAAKGPSYTRPLRSICPASLTGLVLLI